MAPPLSIHGTLISDLNEKGSGARIRWPPNARLLMYAHLARHKLTLANCQNHCFAELVQALDLDHGVNFNTAVHPRLQSALKYSLESLAKMGHVELQRGSQRRHTAIWLAHTDAWSKPGWDGSLGGPETKDSDDAPPDDNAAATQTQTTEAAPAETSHLTSDDMDYEFLPPNDFQLVGNVEETPQAQPIPSGLRRGAQPRRLASNDCTEHVNTQGNLRGHVLLTSHSKTRVPQTGCPPVRVGSGWLRGRQDNTIVPPLRSAAPVSAPARRQHPSPSPSPSAPVTHRKLPQQTGFAGPTAPSVTKHDIRYTSPARLTPGRVRPNQGVGIRVAPSGGSLPQQTSQTSQFQLRNQPEVETGRSHDITVNTTASPINALDKQHFLDMLSHQESVHKDILTSMASLAFTDFLRKSYESGLRPGTPDDLDRVQRIIHLLQAKLCELHSVNKFIEMKMHTRFPFLQGLLNGSALFSAVCESMFS